MQAHQQPSLPPGDSRLLKWLRVVAILSSISTVATGAALWFTRAKPPLLLLDQARSALSAARRAEAPTYAPRLWAQAESSWNYTLGAFAQQRRQWFFDRDYAEAERLARRTHAVAVQARERAVAVRDSLSHATEVLAHSAHREVETYRQTYRNLPAGDQLHQRATRSELLLSEAQQARARGDLLCAAERLREAHAAITDAGNGSASALRTYFANLPTWQKWAQETIAHSKEQHCPVIIVDKFAHLLRVYIDGTLTLEFPVELGPNWMGHKQRRGDNATPEGHYLVTKKKSGRATIYHKALVLDYPNERDRREFTTKKQKGLLPPGAQIGGLIEIHGEGGKGFDWTNGCVALTNKDMDRLFNLVEVGTRVTIVGSLRSWETCLRAGAAPVGTE